VRVRRTRRCIQPRLRATLSGGTTRISRVLYQTAETLTHPRHRPRSRTAPISHWITVRFCNGCPSGRARSMSQGLRVLVLVAPWAAQGLQSNYQPWYRLGPAAPRRCSTRTGCPSSGGRICDASRPARLLGPQGRPGTMILIEVKLPGDGQPRPSQMSRFGPVRSLR
jgi:hypothetical protein